MAFSSNSGGGSGRGGFSSRRLSGGAISEINVTPFVDVVLVLLIIFMLTAHAMQYGLEVEVPKTKQAETTEKERPIITIPKDGSYLLNNEAVNINELGSTIRKRFGKDTESVYVMADKATIYDPIAQVIAELGAQKLKVLLVTQPADSPVAKGRK